MSELGAIVHLKNGIVGAAGMALIAVLFIFLWGSWFLVTLMFALYFGIDAWIMATLHRRNLRRIALDGAREGESPSFKS
jgi:hypothetical protein